MTEQTSDTPRTCKFMVEHGERISKAIRCCNGTMQAAHALVDELAPAWDFARTLERELQQRNRDNKNLMETIRYRESELELARKNLDTAYQMAWHKRDDEVAKLKDEVARLKALLSPPLSLPSEQIKTQPCETIND